MFLGKTNVYSYTQKGTYGFWHNYYFPTYLNLKLRHCYVINSGFMKLKIT